MVDGYRGEGRLISRSARACLYARSCDLPGDEDGNGDADCDDRACMNTEACGPYPPSACEPDVITDLTLDELYVSNNEGAPRQTVGSCAGRGREQVYRFSPATSGVYCASTSARSTTRCSIYAECADPGRIACNDDFDRIRAAITFEADEGEPLFIFADSFRGDLANICSRSLRVSV